MRPKHRILEAASAAGLLVSSWMLFASGTDNPPPSPGGAPMPAPHSAEAVVLADQQWGDAETLGDDDHLRRLLLDGYQSVDSSGRITNKTQIVESARRRGTSAQYARMVDEWKASHPSEPHVALYADTAVLTWVSTANELTAVYSSDVFVYREGQWRAVYSQHSTAAH